MMTRWCAACCAIAILTSCEANPVQPSSSVVVDGTWDARFEGTASGQGTRQTDTFVMELRQSGSTVTGSLWFGGLDLPIPLSGSAVGEAFAYTARASLRPGCEVVVSAETRVDERGMRLSGAQSQSTCEGVATGQVVATRR